MDRAVNARLGGNLDDCHLRTPLLQVQRKRLLHPFPQSRPEYRNLELHAGTRRLKLLEVMRHNHKAGLLLQQGNGFRKEVRIRRQYQDS